MKTDEHANRHENNHEYEVQKGLRIFLCVIRGLRIEILFNSGSFGLENGEMNL
jgi:hypothetical protein